MNINVNSISEVSKPVEFKHISARRMRNQVGFFQ